MKDDSKILALYLHDINKIPLLTREEEIALAKKAKHGDAAAKQKIANANLRFVVSVAKKYQNNGLELADLISEGNIGLLTAIEKFDVSKGYHFISYAVWWIRQAIIKAICEKSRAIRLPLNRVNELMQIQNAKKHISFYANEEDELREIAELTHMDKNLVRDLLAISRDMVSLDAPHTRNGKSAFSIGDYIQDNRTNDPSEHAVYTALQNDIAKVLRTLKPNEAKVLRLRYGLNGTGPLSLREVGKRCNVSKERIRQIEQQALSRMRVSFRRERLASYVA